MLISFVRATILFGLISIVLRLMGKRQIGQLEPSELVVTILLSELVAIPMQNLSLPLLAGIAPVLVVISIDLLLSHVVLKNIRLRRMISGHPSILLHNGKMDKKELSKNRVSIDDFLEALRLKDITDLSTVQYAILETNGQLSTILYPAHRPPTASELKGQQGGEGLPSIIVSDGRWLDKNLQRLQLTRSWAEKEARKRNVKSIEEIFLFTVDENKNIYLQTGEESCP